MTPSIELYRSAYDGIEKLGLQTDVQGWHYEEPIFEELLKKFPIDRLLVYVEVGSYKGASVLRVAKLAKELGIPITCFAVDFWREAGLYEQFLHNVVASGHQDVIVPIRAHSVDGAKILRLLGVQAHLIYIDAGHEFTSCYLDMLMYEGLLVSGGIMFGDDYTEEVGVKMAVEAFGKPYQHSYYHWWLEPKA